jgi:hypothetical protein
VEHGNYKVMEMNEDGSNTYLNASVLCFWRIDDNYNNVNDCEMHVDVVVEGDSFKYIMV